MNYNVLAACVIYFILIASAVIADEPQEAQEAQEESADDTKASSGPDTADGSQEPEEKSGNQEADASNVSQKPEAPSVVPISEPQSPIQEPDATTVGPVSEVSSAVPMLGAVNVTGNDKVQKAAQVHEASSAVQQSEAPIEDEENKFASATQEPEAPDVIQENEVPSASEKHSVTRASLLSSGHKSTVASETDNQDYEYEADPQDSNQEYENEYENEVPNDKYGMESGIGYAGNPDVGHHATQDTGGEPLGLENGNLFYENPDDEYEKENTDIDYDSPPSEGQQSILIPQVQHHKPSNVGQNAVYKGQQANKKPYVQSADIDCY